MSKKEYVCQSCGKRGYSKFENKFCSNLCQQRYRHQSIIKKWKNGESASKGSIKKYLIEKYGEKCTRCGWCEKNEFTKNIPLDMEHIDGNPYNNKEENLTLLCPNCHSLTASYKGANKGNGRKERSKYYHNSDKISQRRKEKKYCNGCGVEQKWKTKSGLCKACHSIKLRKVNRPSKKILLEEIEKNSYISVGKKYGVSDNTIRKWLTK